MAKYEGFRPKISMKSIVSFFGTECSGDQPRVRGAYPVDSMGKYLRRNPRTKGESDYEYWSLAESVRAARGPRGRTVATTGELPDLDKEEHTGQEEIRRILDGKPIPQPSLFEHDEDPPSWAIVDINIASVERLPHLGDVYLGLLLWGKLGFADSAKST